jgi:hypothetical protein
VKTGDYNKTALAFWALKDALLYFDYVVPLSAPLEIVLSEIMIKGNHKVPIDEATAEMFNSTLNRILLAGLPPDLNNEEFARRLVKIYRQSFGRLKSAADMGTPEFWRPIRALVRDYKLSGLPLCTVPRAIEEAREPNDLGIHLAALRLIDIQKTSYEQILELREDQEAKRKLTRLRLFAYENYQGKSQSFIQDDLMTRIADYESTVKKWSFETKSAVMTALMDSKLVAGGIAGSFLSAYMNQPLLAIASAAGAAGIAIGKVTIEIGKKRFELQKAMAENPVSYITYAKEKLAEDQK